MKIVIASDHAGFKLKKDLIEYFNIKEYSIKDLGPDNDLKPKSYARQGMRLANFISKNSNWLGIAICGTGLGISFAVNRIKGIRGARLTSLIDAKIAKKHANSNVLIFGGRTTTFKKAIYMFNAFIREEFENKYLDEIKKIDIF